MSRVKDLANLSSSSSEALFYTNIYIKVIFYRCRLLFFLFFFFLCSSLQKVPENENITRKKLPELGQATDRAAVMQANIVETSKQRESTNTLNLFF